MTRSRWLVLVAAVAFVAAIAGVLVGRTIVPMFHPEGTELHVLLHHHMDLNAGQRARIDALERQFGVRRHALEMELRADNARLAEAIEAEHGDGPRVRSAVDASHHAMGELQKQTLAHVFAMRQTLRPDQTAAFDRAVTQSLTVGDR